MLLCSHLNGFIPASVIHADRASSSFAGSNYLGVVVTTRFYVIFGFIILTMATLLFLAAIGGIGPIAPTLPIDIDLLSSDTDYQQLMKIIALDSYRDTRIMMGVLGVLVVIIGVSAIVTDFVGVSPKRPSTSS